MQPAGIGGTARVTDLNAADGIGPVMSPSLPQVLATDATIVGWEPGNASSGLFVASPDRLQRGPEKDHMLIVARMLMARISRVPSSAVGAAAVRPLHQHKGSAR